MLTDNEDDFLDLDTSAEQLQRLWGNMRSEVPLILARFLNFVTRLSMLPDFYYVLFLGIPNSKVTRLVCLEAAGGHISQTPLKD